VTSPTAPCYRELLDTAYALGRADGRLAAALGLPEAAGHPSPTCRGRDAGRFARSLWPAGLGRPPSGLGTNAPHWYAQGLRDARSGASEAGPAGAVRSRRSTAAR
jgi:hypothetical protein